MTGSINDRGSSKSECSYVEVSLGLLCTLICMAVGGVVDPGKGDSKFSSSGAAVSGIIGLVLFMALLGARMCFCSADVEQDNDEESALDAFSYGAMQ